MEENNIKAPVEEREQTAEELNELLQIRRDRHYRNAARIPLK